MTVDADLALIVSTLECPNQDAPYHTTAGCTWCAGTVPALEAAKRVKAEVARLERERRLHSVERVENLERAEAAEAREVRLRDGLRPFAEKWDLHAADYLAELVDGEEARVLPARVVAGMIEDIRRVRALLAEDGAA